MNYRCKLESNWRTFVGVHESDDLIEIEMIDTVENETILRGERERAREARDTCGQETNFTRRKNIIRLASLSLRECFGPFGEAQ